MNTPIAFCLLSLTALLLSACNNHELVEEYSEHGVLLERYYISPKDSLRQGDYELFDSDGHRIETAHYEDGQLEGMRTIYYANGNVQAMDTHVDGSFNGPAKRYYPDGTLKVSGQYVNGEASGQWEGYHPTGELKERVTFAGNEENGPFTEYHTNGNLAAEGTYLNGDKEQGELRLYDENGELLRLMHCEAGICRTVEDYRPADERNPQQAPLQDE